LAPRRRQRWRGRRRRGLAQQRTAGHADSGADLQRERPAARKSSPPISAIAPPRTALFAKAIAAFGKVDILVNNAGIIRRKAAAQHSDEDWDAVIEVNLSNAFRLSRAMGKHLIETRAPGKIINVASLLSFQGGVTVPGYAAGKRRPRPAHEGARERVGGSRHQRQRHCSWLHADRQHQGVA
jgi:NAD(P)-dependent dehydrogenase (short-subunit alcohol dehydrogenase family)